jgi:hypothetical protein
MKRRTLLEREFRTLMIASICGYNRHLTKEVLENMTIMALWRYYATAIQSSGMISPGR